MVVFFEAPHKVAVQLVMFVLVKEVLKNEKKIVTLQRFKNLLRLD